MTIGNFRASFIREISNYDLPEREGLLRIILEETLGVSAITAMMHNDQEIPHEKTLELKAVCEQLACNIPIQYIYQKASFFGLDLYVDERVLIPRQETEELVDWILTTYARQENLRILDIGTGSGAIAIALKKHLPRAKVSCLL